MASRYEEPEVQVLATTGSARQAPAAPQVARRRYSQDAARMAGTWERMWARDAQWRERWQTLVDYIDPNQTQVIHQAEPGAKQTQRLFDSTAPHAAELMANNIHGALTNNAQKFFSLAARQKPLNDLQSVKAWCEEVADRTYLGINNSNATAEFAGFYKCLTVLSTGATLLEEGPRWRPKTFGGFRYRTLPLGTFCIDEDLDGRVTTLYRKVVGSAQAAVERFPGGPTQGGALPERITRLADKEPEALVALIHAIYPRPDAKPRKADKFQMGFASCYFTLEEKALVAEGGYREFPGAVCRWAKNAGELYGRGPSWLALPDIRTLNRAIELYLSAGAKAVDPVLLELYDSVLGPISLEPAAINTIKEAGALQAMESKTRWEIAEAINERLERKIHAIFMVDQFDTPKAGAPLTATEATIINERTLRMLGPAAGRLLYEWFIPMREREIALQMRAGVLPEPPQELAEQDADLDVVAEGPLARAQRSADLVAIERSYALAGNIATITGDPSIFDNWNSDEAAQEIASITGMPANIARDEQDVAQMRAARQQAQEAQQRMAAIGQGAEMLGKAAPGLKLMQGGQGGGEAAA